MIKSVKNLLMSLKNYSEANLLSLHIDYSTKKINLLDTLYKEGYIQSYSVDKPNLKIYIILRYLHNKPILNNLKIFSQTTSLKNVSLKNISKVSNMGSTLFISTPKGIYTSLECKKKKLAGKVFFFS